MPKRSSSSGKHAREPVEQPPAASDGVHEQGAFAFANCPECGWRGAGRRSRERARRDLKHHLADDPHPTLKDATG